MSPCSLGSFDDRGGGGGGVCMYVCISHAFSQLSKWKNFKIFIYSDIKNTVRLMHQCGQYLVIISRAITTTKGNRRLQESVYPTKKTC